MASILKSNVQGIPTLFGMNHPVSNLFVGLTVLYSVLLYSTTTPYKIVLTLYSTTLYYKDYPTISQKLYAIYDALYAIYDRLEALRRRLYAIDYTLCTMYDLLPSIGCSLCSLYAKTPNNIYYRLCKICWIREGYTVNYVPYNSIFYKHDILYSAPALPQCTLLFSTPPHLLHYTRLGYTVLDQHTASSRSASLPGPSEPWFRPDFGWILRSLLVLGLLLTIGVLLFGSSLGWMILYSGRKLFLLQSRLWSRLRQSRPRGAR